MNLNQEIDTSRRWTARVLFSARVWAVSMVSTAVLALAGFAWESQVSKLDETTVKVMTVRDDLAKEISNSEARISEHEKNDAVRGSEIAAIREDILELKERSLRIEAKLDRILMRVTRSDP